MTARTRRLLYVSRVSPKAHADIEATLKDVLIASVRNNRAAALTGLLVAHQGWFIQALEGPEASIEATFDRIRRDTRHHATQIVASGSLSGRRAFPRWSMCARLLSATDAAILKTLAWRDSFDPRGASEESLLRLLTTVAAIHDRTLEARHAELSALTAAA